MKNAAWSPRSTPCSRRPSATSSAASRKAAFDIVTHPPPAFGWLNAFAFGYVSTASSRSAGSVTPRTTRPAEWGGAVWIWRAIEGGGRVRGRKGFRVNE